jgi:UDP:flavonoid glycosyltransferase YjiC (YdhE family)
VGSRGDVQPFVALGQVLKRVYGHRVRLATHPTFRQFVEENGLEYFCIGGDPAELMAFMVKNPGLMPGIDALKNGDIHRRRMEIQTIISGCWRSCFEAGDGTGAPASDATVSFRNFAETSSPFVADAIIANPPSFAHVHCAERLGIPLHLMFTCVHFP